MSEEGEVQGAIRAVTDLVKAVPVYEDALQPAAKELGKALQVVAKSVHIALAPVSALVWGYEQIRDFVSTKVAERLKDVPIEEIASPKANVAGPLLEALRYAGNEPGLSDLFANLLASSMDKRTAAGAHPAFVEIIRQLTADEAKLVALFQPNYNFPLLNVEWRFKPNQNGLTGGSTLLTNFSHLGKRAGCEYPHLVPTYIDNLCRLGLVEIPVHTHYTAQGIYDELESDPEVVAIKKSIERDPVRDCVLRRGLLLVTNMGQQFAEVCVLDRQSSRAQS